MATTVKGAGARNAHLCNFKDLPQVEGQPHGCAWGVYPSRQDGSGPDELGRLNLLTPDVVQRAATEEIRTGKRVQLDWGLENVQFPGFKRKGLEQRIIDKTNAAAGWTGTDDEISFNTQCSSQWDGFRHKAHEHTQMYYNGLPHTELIAGESKRNGIDAWCRAGGIAGRGVLLDWLAWWENTHPSGEPAPSPVTRHEIPIAELQEVARYQGLDGKFRPGDILLVRSGFVRWHDNASQDERKKGTLEKATYIGMEATPDGLEWFWNHHFAAVGGDAVAFEAWPPAKGKTCYHEWFLAQWGMPIGEMWDLETLSRVCKEQKRWTFFLTSAPLNVPGGVGSPPNAIAIF